MDSGGEAGRRGKRVGGSARGVSAYGRELLKSCSWSSSCLPVRKAIDDEDEDDNGKRREFLIVLVVVLGLSVRKAIDDGRRR